MQLEAGRPLQFSLTNGDASGIVQAVEVRRSNKRRRTITARLNGTLLIIQLPATMSKAEEALWIDKMRRRFEARARRHQINSAEDLERRAQQLNQKFFGGRLSWNSICYVTNQHDRHGSCSVRDATIRLSDRLANMPVWVRDYVIVHELAHLEEANHSKAFWDLVNRYPLTERAKGFLIAKDMQD